MPGSVGCAPADLTLPTEPSSLAGSFLCVSHKPPKRPLFDVGKPAPKPVGPKHHLHALDAPSDQVRLPAKSGLVPSLINDLPVRLVKTHSADKARTVRRDLRCRNA